MCGGGGENKEEEKKRKKEEDGGSREIKGVREGKKRKEREAAYLLEP